MAPPRYPALYQINTRIWLQELGASLGRAVTLEHPPDAALDALAADGFDWAWLLGVWQTGQAGRQISLHQPEWQAEYRELLPDFTPGDVCGSPFAIREYVVNRQFGGPMALEAIRKRLADRNIKLMLDFVPNHTALDHPWVRDHPEFYVQGTDADLAREPANYIRLDTRQGSRVFAHGRDPYFPGWPDTLQLNYRHGGFREAMLGVLDTVASQCDGVRCDMAMLVLPEVIQRTWGERSRPADGSAPVDEPFWPAAIARVHRLRPEFVFMAEAYWDLEWTLQQQGFDYTYDKRLYDRLRSGAGAAVRGHLLADPDYQRRSARFLENHDEPRAAAVFPTDMHRAAAVITFLVPGLRFIHDGQRSGRRLRVSNHLGRRATEPVDRELKEYYTALIRCVRRPEVRDGEWQLLELRAAWDGNPKWAQFVAFSWRARGRRLIVVANYGATRGQCYVKYGEESFAGRTIILHDLMNPATTYERAGNDLIERGLYLDLPAWGQHDFDVM